MNQIENETTKQQPEPVQATLGPVEPPDISELEATGASRSNDIHHVLANNPVSDNPTVRAEDAQDDEHSPEGWEIPAAVPEPQVPAVNPPAPLATTKAVLADMNGGQAHPATICLADPAKGTPMSMGYPEIAKQVDQANVPDGIVRFWTIRRAVDLTDSELDARIPYLYRSGHRIDMEFGETLVEKQRRLALAGCQGKFSAFLREVKVPRSTAYEIITWYKAVREMNTVLLDAAENEIGWAKMLRPNILKSLTEISHQLNGRVPNAEELSEFFKPFSAKSAGANVEAEHASGDEAADDEAAGDESDQDSGGEADLDSGDEVDQDSGDDADQDADDEACQNSTGEPDEDSGGETGLDAEGEGDQDSDAGADQDSGGEVDLDAGDEADQAADTKPEKNDKKPRLQLDHDPAEWTRWAKSVPEAQAYCLNLIGKLSEEEIKANPLLPAFANSVPSASPRDVVRTLFRYMVRGCFLEEALPTAEIIVEAANDELDFIREEMDRQAWLVEPISEEVESLAREEPSSEVIAKRLAEAADEVTNEAILKVRPDDEMQLPEKMSVMPVPAPPNNDSTVRVTEHKKSKAGQEYTCEKCDRKIVAGEAYCEWPYKSILRRQHKSHGYPDSSQFAAASAAVREVA